MDKEPYRERLSRFIREDLPPDWRPSKDQWLWALRIGLVLAVLLGILTLIGRPFDVTLWDWLDLLIVPVFLAIGGYLFTRSENRATQEAAEKRAQDDALQAYLDHIGELLLNMDKPLRQSNEGDEVRTLARARTLTVLSRVDGEHKVRILEFLNESRLIAEEETVVDLTWADLSGATLRGANLRMGDLRKVSLYQADLRGATLSGANMENADLISANLTGANLSGANLKGALLLGTDLSDALVMDANLEDANLTLAKLIGSHLESAILSGADLTSADLSNAILSNEVWLVDAKLRDANLANANLNGAFMNAADLSGASLRGADLRNVLLIQGANLSGADLTNANLNGAAGVSNEQLEQQAKSLEGAIMPDGQKYEDWLKSKGHAEDGENSETS